MIEEMRETLEQQVLNSTNRIEDYAVGSEEREKAVEEAVKLAKARNDTYKTEVDAWAEGERIELEKSKLKVEIQRQEAQAEAEEKRGKLELVKTGVLMVGTLGGTVLLHVLQNSGDIIKGGTSKYIDKIPWWK